MNIIILGSPGVGKGTYTEILSKKYSIPKISSGDLFREAIRKGTELGQKVKEYVSRGDLVPDEIVIELLKDRLEEDDCENGFFLDGFVRTVAQAEAMEKFRKIDKALNFVSSEENILERISGRMICRDCGAIYHKKNKPPKVEGVCDRCGGELYQRPDQIPEVIRNRLQVYHEKTRPLIDYLRRRRLLVDIDANYPLEEIDKVISQCEDALSEIS